MNNSKKYGKGGVIFMNRKRIAGGILCLVFVFTLWTGKTAVAAGQKTESIAATSSDMTYDTYLTKFGDASRPQTLVKIGKEQLDQDASSILSLTETGVMTGEADTAVFRFSVTETGLYALKLRYTTVEGKSTGIQRGLLLDGKVPYAEAGTVTLNRVFRDSSTEKATDSRGNEYTPEQEEVLGTYEQVVYDAQGYIETPLLFYLSAGEHTISLISQREPVILEELLFFNEEAVISYDDLQQRYQEAGYHPASENAAVILQAEDAALKSSQTLYPDNDRTSSLTQPSDVSRVVMNTIGGNNWRYPGQWITWELQVKESGLYRICFRYKQNYTEGQNSVRALYINDELPFAEAQNLSFGFSYDWQMKVLGDEEPYLFYFEAGKTYTLKLENTLGEYADILREAQDSVLALNGVYRQIKMIVGASADQNRDYSIEKLLPQSIETLRQQYDTLKKLAAKTEQISDGKGSGYGTYQKLFVQIEEFLEDPDKLPKQLDTFSSNISSLADYVMGAAEQPLLLDYILISPPGQELPQVKDSFWQKLIFECQAFFASFFTDYNAVGDINASADGIDLWLTSGRDQAEVVKQLIDNGFAKDYQTPVNVRLVTADMILPAAASGKGPDVAVGQEKALPVRYGMRNALLDLSQFDDLDHVLQRFNSGAYAPFFVDEKLYALPDTQNFLMMYVRTDILAELGLTIPNTWDELYHCMYTLQQNNLDIGFPNIDFTSVSENNIEMFYLLLFQHGGELFTEDLSRTRLDEDEAVAAFTEWSELYTKYKVTQQMNHLTRFRTGEAPIVLFNMSFYNTLSLYAPEIKGLWQLCMVPGTVQEDGSIDRSIGSTPTSAVIFSTAASPEACWEFLKWWTSADVQTEYAWGMENALGASGRVLTANLEAFDNLAWPVADRETIKAQREFVRDVPEIAGSYVFDRYLCTAMRYTIEKNADPREILLEWNQKINVENEIRRREFGLE